ncbi:MAG: hypothetical protein FWD23_17570, partial [Oscillospiraceae bacterium]|nr:hypothetical protein [Oscillospiraceae bacterium]
PYALETDADNNIFYIGPNWNKNETWLYIFYAEDDYSADTMLAVKTSRAMGGGKYASYYVPETKLLWYATFTGDIYIFDLSDPRNPVHSGSKEFDFGTAKLGYTAIMQATGDDIVQYPHLYWTPEDHTMHLAWTTADMAVYHYRSINYVRTGDNGATWRNMPNEILPELFKSGTSPEAERQFPTKITRDIEDTPITWLQSFIVKNGRAHFIYRVSDNSANVPLAGDAELGMRYRVFDVNTGELLIDILSDTFHGADSLDGFFVSNRTKDEIYYVSYNGTYIIALVTKDNGDTWEHFADGWLDGGFTAIYALGGCREIKENGIIWGSYAAMRPDSGTNEHAVAYLKIISDANK